MKKMLFLFSWLLVMGGLRSQSMADARKLVYYERYEGAAHSLQAILKTDPNNVEAWYLLTQVWLHEGKTRTLADSISLAPAPVAGTPLMLCAHGQLLLHEGKKDSATACFNKALADTKEKDPQLLLAVAKAQVEDTAGDAGYAITLLNKAIKRDKHNPELYVVMGNAYRRLADGTSSYQAYQNALAQDSRYACASYKLGKIFVTQDNPEMYLKFFNDAVSADSLYAPAWYELYYHYYFKDAAMAMNCLNHYIAATDRSLRNDYLMTDLLYASKKYKDAIQNATQIIAQQGASAEPRLYKLIGYSYRELNDSAGALDNMRRYFSMQNDTAFVVKDYETMAEIFDKLMNRPDSAVRYYVLAEGMEKDSVKAVGYYKKLAGLCKQLKDYPDQAIWLGKYYQHNPGATNLDLFNWGIAYYQGKNYPMADSIFGMYEAKYPDQCFGYYWRARSDAAIDTAMSTGMAVPNYLKIIEIDGKDTANKVNKKHLIESYGYIAAYRANTQKDYPGAIDYFQKLLDLDPENADARRYIEILKKNQSRAASKAAAAAGTSSAGTPAGAAAAGSR